MAKVPKWFVDGHRLLKVKEVRETKKTFLIKFEGLLAVKQFKKKDRRFHYKKRKPLF